MFRIIRLLTSSFYRRCAVKLYFKQCRGSFDKLCETPWNLWQFFFKFEVNVSRKEQNVKFCVAIRFTSIFDCCIVLVSAGSEFIFKITLFPCPALFYGSIHNLQIVGEGTVELYPIFPSYIKRRAVRATFIMSPLIGASVISFVRPGTKFHVIFHFQSKLYGNVCCLYIACKLSMYFRHCCTKTAFMWCTISALSTKMPVHLLEDSYHSFLTFFLWQQGVHHSIEYWIMLTNIRYYWLYFYTSPFKSLVLHLQVKTKPNKSLKHTALWIWLIFSRNES